MQPGLGCAPAAYALTRVACTHLSDHPDCRQPDGSVHGNARSYGPYEGSVISISTMLNDDGNSWRLCDTPEACTLSLASCITLSLTNHGTAPASAQASIWGDFSECYDDSFCTNPDGSDGTDCWTLLGHDTCGCSRGRPKTTGKLTPYGVSFFYVSPLPQDVQRCMLCGCRGLS